MPEFNNKNNVILIMILNTNVITDQCCNDTIKLFFLGMKHHFCHSTWSHQLKNRKLKAITITMNCYSLSFLQRVSLT